MDIGDEGGYQSATSHIHSPAQMPRKSNKKLLVSSEQSGNEAQSQQVPRTKEIQMSNENRFSERIVKQEKYKSEEGKRSNKE